MRCERLVWGLLLCVTVLSGCVATRVGTGLAGVTKAQEAQDAARVHTELGQHYMELGDLQTALHKLKLALHFDKNYAPTYTVLAVVYERIHDFSDALANYRKAQRLEPGKGAPNNNLGAFLCRRGKVHQALPYFRRALADPFYTTPDVAWTNAGVCRLQIHDYKGAEASFRRAIAINAANTNALFQLARVMYRKHDAFHARIFLERYEALARETPAALKLGHAIEMRLGHTAAAHRYLKRLQKRFPNAR